MYERLATGSWWAPATLSWPRDPGFPQTEASGQLYEGWEGESGDQWITDHKGQLMGPGAHIESVIVNLRASVRASVSPSI